MSELIIALLMIVQWRNKGASEYKSLCQMLKRNRIAMRQLKIINAIPVYKVNG